MAIKIASFLIFDETCELRALIRLSAIIVGCVSSNHVLPDNCDFGHDMIRCTQRSDQKVCIDWLTFWYLGIKIHISLTNNMWYHIFRCHLCHKHPHVSRPSYLLAYSTKFESGAVEFSRVLYNCAPSRAWDKWVHLSHEHPTSIPETWVWSKQLNWVNSRPVDLKRSA